MVWVLMKIAMAQIHRAAQCVPESRTGYRFSNTENFLLLTQMRILSKFVISLSKMCTSSPKKTHQIYTNLKNCLHLCQKNWNQSTYWKLSPMLIHLLYFKTYVIIMYKYRYTDPAWRQRQKWNEYTKKYQVVVLVILRLQQIAVQKVWFSPGTPVSFFNKTDLHDISQPNQIIHFIWSLFMFISTRLMPIYRSYVYPKMIIVVIICNTYIGLLK
jgi:hypothetical protein